MDKPRPPSPRLRRGGRARFDAPFWALLVLGIMVVGALGCFGLAAAAQDASRDGTAVLTTVY